MNWADAIKDYRERSGLLQKQLANLFDVDVMTVSRWERGVSEPSKFLKGRLKDLLTVSKDPLTLPFVQQITRFGTGVSVIDLNSETFAYFGNHDGLTHCQLSLDEFLGKHPMRFVKTDMVRQAYEEIGGYSGMKKSGLLSYNYTLNLELPDPAPLIELMGSVLRFEGYDPVLVVQRRVSEKPVMDSVANWGVSYLDDLPTA